MARWLVVGGLCVTLAAGCVPEASAPTPPVPMPTASTVARGGVSVTLSVASRQLLAGTQTAAFLEIHNDSAAEVFFDRDLCLLEQSLSFDGSYGGPPQPTENPGRTWSDARLAWVKTTALYNPVSVIGFRPASAGDDLRTPLACAVVAAGYGLRPGGVIRDDEIVVARRTDGLPAWPGTYVAGFTFPTDDPIHVEVRVDVIGPTYAGISRAQAVDAALADAEVAAWLVSIGKSGIEDGAAWFDRGTWTITIRTWTGQGTVTVDPGGHVIARSIPAIAP
jgi:hypothetical protein